MNTETEQFESTETFEETPQTVEKPELTEQELYEQSFEAEVNPPNTDDAQANATQKRIYETMTDDELKAVFEKAKQVDELNERLKKTHDGAFGRIGSIESALKELRDMRPTAAPINPEMFTNLRAFLDDDSELVDALAKDLSALQLGIPLVPNIDLEAKFADEASRLEQRQQAFAEQQEQLRREFEMKLVDMQHPDWREVSQTQEFEDWMNTLKPEDKQTLETAWDGIVISRGMTKFKDWRAKKAEFESKKSERIAGNMPLNGSGSARPAPTYEDDYLRAFNEGLRGT